MSRLSTELRNSRRDALPRIPDVEDVEAIFAIPNSQRRDFAVKRLHQTLAKLYDLVKDEVHLSSGQRRLLERPGTKADAKELTAIVTIFRESLGDRVAFPKMGVKRQGELTLPHNLIRDATETMHALGEGDSICLVNVFGTKEPHAMQVFIEAASALDRLYKQNRIFVDSRNFMAATNCEALTDSTQMLLPADFIDAGHNDQIRKLVHESTHAIENQSLRTGDQYYRNQKGFAKTQWEVRPFTAAYYEEAAYQYLDVPSRKKLKPVGINPNTKFQQDIYQLKVQDAANAIIQEAWITALNIYQQLVEIAQNPRKYVFHQRLVMSSSRILGLSLHKGLGKKRGGELPKVDSITNADLAQAENRVNGISHLIGMAARVTPVDSDDNYRSSSLPDGNGRGRAVIAVIRGLLESSSAERLRRDKDKELRMIRVLHGLYQMNPLVKSLQNADVGAVEKYMQRGAGNAGGIVKKHEKQLKKLCCGWEAILKRK